MSDWGILQTFITHPSYITVGIQSSSWPHAEDKIRPLIRTVCCKGWTTWIFSSWGKSHTRQNIVFFRRLLPFAPIAPLPPDGFVLVRWEGGLCGDFCALLAALLFLRRGVLAGRRGRSIFFWKKNPASDIITRCLYACIHVRTHCHSLTALSLSLYLHHL